MLRIPLTLLVLGLIGLATNAACAEDAKAPQQESDAKPPAAAQPAAERDFSVLEADLAFERYIRLELIGEAWSQLNSAMMTDAVLQLAEGERVLLREHKLLGAAALADIAIKLAAENNDNDSLARLAKFATSRDNKALAQQIVAAEKMTGASRRLAIQIDINELRSDHLERYKSISHEIVRAKLSQDVSALERIEADMAAFVGFHPALRDAVLTETSMHRKLLASNRDSVHPDGILTRGTLLARIGKLGHPTRWRNAIRVGERYAGGIVVTTSPRRGRLVGMVVPDGVWPDSSWDNAADLLAVIWVGGFSLPVLPTEAEWKSILKLEGFTLLPGAIHRGPGIYWTRDTDPLEYPTRARSMLLKAVPGTDEVVLVGYGQTPRDYLGRVMPVRYFNVPANAGERSVP